MEGWVDLGTAGQVQQPVPKTAYPSNCRDKRTEGGSHPQPGTPTLDHCTLLGQVGVRNLARITTQQRSLGIELTTIESQVERPTAAKPLMVHSWEKMTGIAVTRDIAIHL